MRRRAALAAAGAVALFMGFGITWFGGQDRTPAGHRESSQTIAAASAPLDLIPSEDSARADAEVEQAEAERLEAERLERVAAEQAAEAQAEKEREAVRLAAVAAEKARKAAEVVVVTPTTVRAAPVARTPVSESSGSGACGGSLPPCYVMQRESGGNPRAVSPASYCGGRGCYGKWQFDPRTSQGLGYPGTMDQYPESVQDEAARTLWNGGRGCSHCGAC